MFYFFVFLRNFCYWPENPIWANIRGIFFMTYFDELRHPLCIFLRKTGSKRNQVIFIFVLPFISISDLKSWQYYFSAIKFNFRLFLKCAKRVLITFFIQPLKLWLRKSKLSELIQNKGHKNGNKVFSFEIINAFTSKNNSFQKSE